MGAASLWFSRVRVFASMRNPLKRYYGRGDLHFVTFSCYRRLPLLGTGKRRDRFVKILDRVRARHKFLLIGYVVMPEHVHLLLTEPHEGNPSKVLQALKQTVSRSLRKRSRNAASGQLTFRFASSGKDAGHFWQRHFYDFNVWSDKKRKEKLDYMHANPVTRKLVSHPKDWPWSSWSYYAKGEKGLIQIDRLQPPEEKNPHP